MPSDLTVLKEQLEQQMDILGRGINQAVPISPAPAVTPPSGPGPTPGTVVGGYRFIGGNPNDRASGEAI